MASTTPKPQPPATPSTQAPHGRSATGADSTPNQKPRQPQPPAQADKPTSEPKLPSTPTSYRAKRAAAKPGVYLTDEQLLAGVHEAMGSDLAHVADEDVLAMCGWTDQVAGAVRKIRKTIGTAPAEASEQQTA